MARIAFLKHLNSLNILPTKIQVPWFYPSWCKSALQPYFSPLSLPCSLYPPTAKPHQIPGRPECLLCCRLPGFPMQNALVFILRQVKSHYSVTLSSYDPFSRKSSLSVMLILTLSYLQAPLHVITMHVLTTFYLVFHLVV